MSHAVGGPPEEGDSRLPRGLAPLFQDYELERISPEEDRTLVIERVLAYGDRGEVRWLLRRYGRAEVVEWLAMRADRLPRRRRTLWCNVFEVAPPATIRTTGIWRH
jgi:hypothetical protein